MRVVLGGWLHQGFILGTLFCLSLSIKHDPGLHYLNSFVIRVDGDSSVANKVATELGFRVRREISSIEAYELEHLTTSKRSKRSHRSLVDKLLSHPSVYHAEQQERLERVKRRIVYGKRLDAPIRALEDKTQYHRYVEDNLHVKKSQGNTEVEKKCKSFTLSDPFFKDQWYLCNYGQTTNGIPGIDLNVVIAWQNGITGKGVVVTELDDGLDHTHPDLIDNYDPKASTDLNELDDEDPMPNDKDPDNSHGTRCVGEIAMKADNGICGVGVAHNAKIGGIRILDGRVTDSKEAEALNYNYDHIDIYVASWGPRDDGKTIEAPRILTSQALKKGVRLGRKKKGSIYVWATGNGGMHDDDCNADGYVSTIESLSVGSITEFGERPYYMEICSSTLVVVPTGGEVNRGDDNKLKAKGEEIIRIVTTDLHHGCIEKFQGTSAAAPLAAGCVALTLEANPNLGWRDVQHIAVKAAMITNKHDKNWLVNGAGHHINHKFGFGVMDCGRMVQLAQGWDNVPEQHICETPLQETNKRIPPGGVLRESLYTDGCKGDADSRIDSLEHVQLHIKVGGGVRGDLMIMLQAPSGTKSVMLKTRKNDDKEDVIDFTFMTVHNWDENPGGKWSIEVLDKPENKRYKTSKHVMYEWKLTLYGSTKLGVGSRDVEGRGQRAWHPSTEDLDKMMLEERDQSSRVAIKRQDEKRNNLNQDSDKDISKMDDSEVIGELYNTLRNVLDENPDLTDDDSVAQIMNNEKRKLATQHENSHKKRYNEESRNLGSSRQQTASGSESSYKDYYRHLEEKKRRLELMQEINEEIDDILNKY